jgi:hypothetical protein
MSNRFSNVLSTLFRPQPVRPPSRKRAILHVEELGQRIMPSAYTDRTDADHNHLWSDANNWDNGLPDPTHIPLFASAKAMTT